MSGAEHLGHGISTIRLPLPFRSPDTVNAYVLESGGGLTLIDCGVGSEEGMAALSSGFATLGLDMRAVDNLIVTHLHPDHVGLAPRLIEELGCRLVMHETAVGRLDRYNDTEGLIERTRRLADRHGVPRELRAALADLGPRPPWMPVMKPPDVTVTDGEMIPLGTRRNLEVIHTPGHESTHICLRDSLTGILFAGDHVLPRITPVIMYDEDAADTLGDYLASLDRLISMEIGLTYPAHGAIVERGTKRVEQIILHHDRRLSGMEDAVRLGPATAWKVLRASFRPHLSPLEQRLALRETVAHLEYLRLREHLRAFEEDGTLWYRK